MTTDKLPSTEILISSLKLPVHIGCSAAERENPQMLELNLTITLGDSKAFLSGKPEDSVCYKTVCENLQTMVANNEWSLLEQFGEDITKNIFEKFGVAKEITVEIRKFVIPLTNWVGVRLTRDRAADVPPQHVRE